MGIDDRTWAQVEQTRYGFDILTSSTVRQAVSAAGDESTTLKGIVGFCVLGDRLKFNSRVFVQDSNEVHVAGLATGNPFLLCSLDQGLKGIAGIDVFNLGCDLGPDES